MSMASGAISLKITHMSETGVSPDSVELRALRLAARYTQEEFARLLGVDRGRYKNWEYHVRPPAAILALARQLVHQPNATTIPLTRAGPVSKSLGEGDLAVLPAWRARGGVIGDEEFSFEDGDLDDPIAVPAFLCSPGPIEGYRAVIVSGFSMARRIDSGAVLVVRMVDEVSSGTIAVVQAEAGRLYVKTFARDGHGNPCLMSINGAYPPIEARHLRGWRVRAVAVGIIHPYIGGGPNIEWDAGRPLRA